jgi:uncharacterized protein (TIGR03435 family)
MSIFHDATMTRRISLFLMAFSAAFTQLRGPAPEFDAVSVRLTQASSTSHTSLEGGPGTADPGRIRYQFITLMNLVAQAFGVAPRQVLGPPWLETVRIDITATIPKGATKEQLRQMMKKMLGDRFGLKSHYARVEVPGYLLMVDARGAKLKEAVEVGSEPAVAVGGPLSFQRDTDGFSGPPPHPGLNLAMKAGATRVKAMGGTITELKSLISGRLNQEVVDTTGLTGKYDFTLTFASSDAATQAEVPYPPIASALRTQLGLRLLSKKVLVDQVVIDSIEKNPTEN